MKLTLVLITLLNFLTLARLGFHSKRKTLINNLLSEYDKPNLEELFKKLELSLTVRAENLSISQWQQLAQHLST